MNTKLNLTIVTDNFLPRRDGIVVFLLEIIKRLKHHFHITVICPKYKGKHEHISGVQFVYIPVSSRSVADFTFARFRPSKMVRSLMKADIVFSQTIGPIGGTGLFLAQTFKKKTVSFIHSVEWELFSHAVESNVIKKHGPTITKKLLRLLYSRSSHLLVPSEKTAELLTWQNIKTKKTVVHLGVDVERFQPIKDSDLRRKERERLGIKQDDFVIGYHGRISRDKDVLTLLRAYVKLRKQYPHFKLLIVGSGIADLVKLFKRQKGVIYIPSTGIIEKYVPLMDVYCLPSLTETTSLSTLEAMSCELPVIVTKVGYVQDYIIEGVNGIFFPKKDSHILAKKIEYLANRPHFRSILGKQARKTVTEQFNWDRTGEQLELFFTSLAGDYAEKKNN